MGGKGSGPRPDMVRQRRATSLYAKGLSVAQVAARMRCSRMAVYHLLRDAGVGGVGLPIRCAGCGALLARVRTMGMTVDVYCGDCLAQRPEVPFRVRLRSLRLAAGLTQGQLARRVGVDKRSVHHGESGRRPWSRTLARLVAVLGPGLLAEEG